MLHEFAVDPEALSTWHGFRYLIERFGVDQGRLISKFPSNWKRRVYDSTSNCRDVEKKKIEVQLKSIDAKLIANGRAFGNHPQWLPNAEDEHVRMPFRAIISTSNPQRSPHVLLADELSDEINLWSIRREAKVEREAASMSSCVTLLFRASQIILFVDPHFKPEAWRYRKTLMSFLQTAIATGRTFVRIEYHLNCQLPIDYFVKSLRELLLPKMPNGCQVTFFRWEQRSPGEKLHARYILTDIGGFRFEAGLDDGEQGETIDIGILEHELYSERWQDYQWSSTDPESSTYKLKDRVRVTGGQTVVILGPQD